MKYADDIEKAVRNFFVAKTTEVKTTAGMDKRIINDALGAHEQSKRMRPSALPLNIRRTIMKNRTAKLAVAAVVIVAVSTGIYLFTGSGTSVALGQVKAAMEKIDWVHSINEGSSLEGWFAFESKVIIEKQEDGTINYFNSRRNRQYFYDPVTETIEIRKIVPDDVFAAGFEDPFFKRYDGPFEFLADMAKLIQAEGGKFKQSTGEYEGTKVVIWEFSDKDSGFTGVLAVDVDGNIQEVPGIEYCQLAKIFIDSKRHLPLATETRLIKDGKIIREMHTKLEYPEVGPKDIYDLGVPKSAQIVDRTQQSK
jgi:hypothetical protein